jgi:O-antigen ligase
MSSPTLLFDSAGRTQVHVQALLRWLLFVPLVIAGLVDLPRLIEFGPISMAGALSAAQVAVACAGLLFAFRYPRVALIAFLPYGCFLGWMLCRSLFSSYGQGELQNSVVYGLFGSQFLLAATLAASNPLEASRMIRRGFIAFDTLGLGLVVLSLVLAGLPTGAEDGGWLVGARSVGILGILPVSWHSAAWYHGRRGAGVRGIAWVIAVLLSLSRMALLVVVATAAITVALQIISAPGRFVRRVPVLVVGAVLFVAIVASQASTFYERFFEGYTQVDIAGVAVPTSGRSNIWPIVIESALQHPIIGGGLGSSQAAVGDFDPETVGHPHNDYLRVWHDGGLIGLTLLMLAFVRWMMNLSRQWRRARVSAAPHPEVELAAILALFSVMVVGITDNGFVYPSVMGTTGLLLGAAYGLRAYHPVGVRLRSPSMQARSRSVADRCPA